MTRGTTPGLPPEQVGVLFDIDDTLVDFGGAVRDALLGLDFGEHAAGVDVLGHWHQVSETHYNRYLAGEVDFDRMRNDRMTAMLAVMDPGSRWGLDPAVLEERRNESIFDHYRLYPDVLPVLDRLSAEDVPVGVVSNSDGDYQRRKMTVVELGHLLGGAVFSGDAGVSKPEPEIFRLGAAAIGLPVDRVVYVGDRWATDALGALGAGMSAVWLNRLGVARPGELSTGLAELPDLDQLDRAFLTRLTAPAARS